MRLQEIYLEPDADMPNNRALPVLVYKAVLPTNAPYKDKAFTDRFEENGWSGVWRDGIYDYHHFHSNAHEVLGVARGRVEIKIGGKNGRSLRLQAGDLIILPAGTGHKKMDSSKALLVIGAYPLGQENYDICRDVSECPDAAKQIAEVALPAKDPFYGDDGPLMESWHNILIREKKPA